MASQGVMVISCNAANVPAYRPATLRGRCWAHDNEPRASAPGKGTAASFKSD